MVVEQAQIRVGLVCVSLCVGTNGGGAESRNLPPRNASATVFVVIDTKLKGCLV